MKHLPDCSSGVHKDTGMSDPGLGDSEATVNQPLQPQCHDFLVPCCDAKMTPVTPALSALVLSLVYHLPESMITVSSQRDIVGQASKRRM